MTALLTSCAGPDAAGTSIAPASTAATSTPPAASQPPATPLLPAPDRGGPPATAPTRTFPAEGAVPVRLEIDAIGVTDDLIPLGIQADGAMQVPEDWQQVGWFSGGGRPGGRGPTVLAGHVDSPTGPAVFVRLRELAPGDAVRVTDVEGIVHDYVVTEVTEHAKSDFPTADVFGVIPRDELRLITCGGFFDPSSGHYEDNLVVHAAPA